MGRWDEKGGGERRKKVGRAGREKREREKEKGDTFITRRRATGKIERQVVFARGSLPGPHGGLGAILGGLSVARMELAVHGKEDTAYGSRGTRSIAPEIIFYAK